MLIAVSLGPCPLLPSQVDDKNANARWRHRPPDVHRAGWDKSATTRRESTGLNSEHPFHPSLLEQIRPLDGMRPLFLRVQTTKHTNVRKRRRILEREGTSPGRTGTACTPRYRPRPLAPSKGAGAWEQPVHVDENPISRALVCSRQPYGRPVQHRCTDHSTPLIVAYEPSRIAKKRYSD